MRQQRQVRQEEVQQSIPDDMQNEITQAFNFYSTDKCTINRVQLRNLLGNFAFHDKNVKQIEETIKKEFNEGKFQADIKDAFSLNEIQTLIHKEWFKNEGGKHSEGQEIWNLFNSRNKGTINIQDIKHVFSEFLDMHITDQDINDFLFKDSGDKQIDQNCFLEKLGYI